MFLAKRVAASRGAELAEPLVVEAAASAAARGVGGVLSECVCPSH